MIQMEDLSLTQTTIIRVFNFKGLKFLSIKNPWVYIFEGLQKFYALCSDIIMPHFHGWQTATKPTKFKPFKIKYPHGISV